jgi:hypothetical protein
MLNRPYGLFVTSNNIIYISDSDNHRIRKISRNGFITTVAGTGESGYNGDNIQATLAKLYLPYSLFVTSDNSVYISDLYNNCIRKVSPNGIITTIAGTGKQGYDGDNIQATSAQLVYPEGVFVTSDNTVYIADTYNHRIRKVSPSGIITTIAGTGVNGYNGDNILATSATLYCPDSVYVTADNTIIFSDTRNCRIRKVSPTGIITTIAGRGDNYGYNGDNIQATSALLNVPYGIYVSSDNSVYIADTDNNRIRKVIFPTGII